MYLFIFSIKTIRCIKVAREQLFAAIEKVCLFYFIIITRLNLIIKKSVAFFSVSIFGEQFFFVFQFFFQKFSNFFKR